MLTTRRLRDLIYPTSGKIKPEKQHELAACWVVITRPIRNQYIMGISGAVASLEPLTINTDLIQVQGVDRIFIAIESDGGRTKWQAFRPLRLVVSKGT